jgi:chloramphenicol O-acetyltransferase type A
MKSTMYNIIDIESWQRKDAFLFFKNFDDPFFNVSVNVDVTSLYKKCKSEKLPFTLSMLYYSNKILNSIPEFRMRLKSEKVIEFEKINVSFTVLHEDNTFTFCYLDFEEDFNLFIKNGKQRIDQELKTKKLDGKADLLDTIHYSILPWLQFTTFKHARRFNSGDSIPKITIGKRFQENDKWKIPISVEVHHALMDGFHLGQYFQKWELEMNSLV